MASMTVSGVVSGMDWEGMITQIIENAQKPAMVQVNKRTNLTNKKALFEEMQDLTKTLQSATTSLRFSSTYQAKNVQLERLDTNGSAKGVLTAKVNADAKAGVYNVEVKQLAQAYTRRSNRVEGNSNDILKGYAGTKLTFTQNGTTSSVEVGENDTLATLASRINNTVKTTSNPMNFTASVVDSRLIFKSDDMGRGTVKYADTLKYDGTGVTKLDDIDIDIDNGDIVLTSKDGKTTYTYGTDFDIVNGNQIRWRTKDVATVDVGDSFTLKYTAEVGDTYTSPTIPRGSGSMDSDALTFTPTNTDGNLVNRLTIKDKAGFEYKYGTDFTFSGKSIKWLSTGNAPDADMTYTVSYTAKGGEVFDVDASRGNTDAVTYTAEGSTTTNLLYADVPAGTVTIETEDGTTLYSGVDFDLVPDSKGNAVVQWNAGSTWTLPEPGSEYSLNITQGEGDTAATKTYTLTRSASDSVSLSDAGFSVANGSVSAIDYGDDEDIDITTGGMALAATVDGSAKTVNLTWSAPTSSTHSNLPASGDELSIEYRYSGNTFQIDDGGSGLLAALGLDLTDEDHLTEAQDAIVAFDGEEWNLVSNELDYENDILNGVKMEFKGVGEVSVEVTHDTEKAVEAVQTYVDAYNALMDWINTRSSEKQVNTDYSEDNTNVLSTNSDDFHTSWGLLYGNSYLRSTKTTLRTLMGQNFSYTFKERTSSEAVYGTMEFNGLKQDTTTTLRIAVGTRWANITITPEDTLDTIAAKINDTTNNENGNEAWQLHYDDSGSLQNYVKAEVVNDKLVIKQGTTATDEVSLSGTTAMNLLHMNYQYKGLYQIGIETTSDNYGISGELEFDSVAFTDALEENPEETEQLMMAFAKQMDAQMKKMLQSSGGYSGTLTQEIQNIESQITTIDEYLKKFQDRLDRQEESLRSQYAAAEERISKLSQQASSIAGIMSQLGSGGGSGSSGSGS